METCWGRWVDDDWIFIFVWSSAWPYLWCSTHLKYSSIFPMNKSTSSCPVNHDGVWGGRSLHLLENLQAWGCCMWISCQRHITSSNIYTTPRLSLSSNCHHTDLQRGSQAHRWIFPTIWRKGIPDPKSYTLKALKWRWVILVLFNETHFKVIYSTHLLKSNSEPNTHKSH